uniref:Cyclin-like domain-containing protein n=1 Tax=Timema cristinae TaxID=61476 RepID=A0A7R9GSX8_TIMCR|nr:unnamed protein product [Timema cristinae]
MAAEEKWYFTKEQLANTPSRRCGFSADRELSSRQAAAHFIQDMGQKLQVTQLCINTAIVYMHRFYVFHSFTQFHRHSMAAAALFLAAKVEEQPRKLEHVIKISHMCLHREQPAIDTKSEQYLELAQDLVFNENVLLQTLGFDVAIDHPHTNVVRCCELVNGKSCLSRPPDAGAFSSRSRCGAAAGPPTITTVGPATDSTASKDLAQTSYFMATNRCLHLTTMCLQYKPTLVACFCIHLAYKWSNWELPKSNEDKVWFWYVDKTVTLDQLEALCAEFLVVFDKCPTKLKRKIMSISASQNPGVPATMGSSLFDDPRKCRLPEGQEGSSSHVQRPHSDKQGYVAPSEDLFKKQPQQLAPGMPRHKEPPRDYQEYREKKERERLAQAAAGGHQHGPANLHHHKPGPPGPVPKPSPAAVHHRSAVSMARDLARREQAHAREVALLETSPHDFMFGPPVRLDTATAPADPLVTEVSNILHNHLGSVNSSVNNNSISVKKEPQPDWGFESDGKNVRHSVNPSIDTPVKRHGQNYEASRHMKVPADHNRASASSGDTSMFKDLGEGRYSKDVGDQRNKDTSHPDQRHVNLANHRPDHIRHRGDPHRQEGGERRQVDLHESKQRPMPNVPPGHHIKREKGEDTPDMKPQQPSSRPPHAPLLGNKPRLKSRSPGVMGQSHSPFAPAGHRTKSPGTGHHFRGSVPHHHSTVNVKTESGMLRPDAHTIKLEPSGNRPEHMTKPELSLAGRTEPTHSSSRGNLIGEEKTPSLKRPETQGKPPLAPIIPVSIKTEKTESEVVISQPLPQTPNSRHLLHPSQKVQTSTHEKSSGSSHSVRESPYPQRSAKSSKQRTPPSAGRKPALQESPNIPHSGGGMTSPFGSPPPPLPVTPGKTGSNLRTSRHRTSSSSSEPELVPVVKKLDDIAGYENILREAKLGTGIKLPGRVPDIIQPIRDRRKEDIGVKDESAQSMAKEPKLPDLNRPPPSQDKATMEMNIIPCPSPSPSDMELSDGGEKTMAELNTSVESVIDVTSVPEHTEKLLPLISTLPVLPESSEKKSSEHHHKAKKLGKEKHRHKEKHKSRDKDDKDKKHKDKKHKHREKDKDRHKIEKPSEMVAIAAPIKITIPKDKLVLSPNMEQNATSGGLKFKIAKERLTPQNTSSSGGSLKMKISKDIVIFNNATAAPPAESSSRKRERSSPVTEVSAKSARLSGTGADASRRSHHAKQNGVESSTRGRGSSSQPHFSGSKVRGGPPRLDVTRPPPPPFPPMGYNYPPQYYPNYQPFMYPPPPHPDQMYGYYSVPQFLYQTQPPLPKEPPPPPLPVGPPPNKPPPPPE